VLADGHVIFILDKFGSYLKNQNNPKDDIRVSKNKIFGILIVALSNIALTVYWQNFAAQIACGYLFFSCLEYYLL
jgi:hypothetical protein